MLTRTASPCVGFPGLRVDAMAVAKSYRVQDEAAGHMPPRCIENNFIVVIAIIEHIGVAVLQVWVVLPQCGNNIRFGWLHAGVVALSFFTDTNAWALSVSKGAPTDDDAMSNTNPTTD
jgi:hypothetical protein